EAAAAELESGLRHQRKLMDGGSCEATAFAAAGYRASGLALPLGNYHNGADEGPAAGVAAEHVLVDDYLAEIALLTRLALEPSLLDPRSEAPPWLAERTAAAMEALVGGSTQAEPEG
ncbi:MAG TPA: hypothetical protein VMN58_03795, partial [Acidimicrobiales bacterium]|nr:hypothetical protein [Acidimicrobiales bacterium]